MGKRLTRLIFCILLAGFFCAAHAETTVLSLHKLPVQAGEAGVYTYELSLNNVGDSELKRIFLQEEGYRLPGGETVPGAFVSYTGNADVLLNQNGTATVLRLGASGASDGSDHITLRYEATLPQGVTPLIVQTACTASVLLQDATGKKQYTLLATADEGVIMAKSTPKPTAVPTPQPTPTYPMTGGKLTVVLQTDSFRLEKGARMESDVTLANAGSGTIFDITVALSDFTQGGTILAPGEWVQIADLTERVDGTLSLGALAPGETRTLRCAWQMPQEDFGVETALGAVNVYGTAGEDGRQDACAACSALPEADAPWQLHLGAGVVLTLEDCIWIAATAIMCLLLILCWGVSNTRKQEGQGIS